MFFLSIFFTAALIIGLVSAITHIKQLKAAIGKIFLIGIGIFILFAGGIHGLLIGLIILLVAFAIPTKPKKKVS